MAKRNIKKSGKPSPILEIKKELLILNQNISQWLAQVKNRKFEKTTTIISLILVFLTTFATLVMAYVAFFQLPQFAESFQHPELIVDVEPYSFLGGYIPIEIQNVGNAKATNLTVIVKSCYMDVPIPYNLGSIYPHDLKLIQFKHRETLDKHTMHDCISGSDFNVSDYEVRLIPYRNKLTGQIFKPGINVTKDVCGYCYWTINITANDYETHKRPMTQSTIGLEFYIEGDDIDFNNTELYEPIDSIGLAIVDYHLMKVATGALS